VSLPMKGSKRIPSSSSTNWTGSEISFPVFRPTTVIVAIAADCETELIDFGILFGYVLGSGKTILSSAGLERAAFRSDGLDLFDDAGPYLSEDPVSADALHFGE
jgi:hypothetical protein